VLAVAFAAVVVRLVDLQVVSPGRYAAAGIAQRLRTVPLPAERGSIFDRNGNDLAMSVPHKTVWADPQAVTRPGATAAAVAPLLGLDARTLARRLTSLKASGGRFLYLARQIKPALAAKVSALDLDGIALLDESKRVLPAGGLASSVLGRTNLDNTGYSGLEVAFEKSLVGVPGTLEIERGPYGTIAGGRQHVTAAKRGSDLVLTLDRSLQYEVERALAEEMRSNRAEHASAIVMDPTTGAILAMANLARDEAGNPVPTTENRALTTTFEPGSVNKVITVAGALEEGIFRPQSVLRVPDRHRVSTHVFSDHDPHPPADWTLTDILTQSSNVGTIKIAQALGPTRMKEYLKRFGLGELSGLGLPQETRGITNFGHWNGTDIGSIPIGQGVGVNALQMLQVFNTLANGGVWVQPHLVQEIVDPDGKPTRPQPPETRRVISERTAKELTAMMTNVVSVGTGTSARISGYTVAGKTGTPRKVINGAYAKGAYVPNFVGFVPAESPRLAAIVVMDEPRPLYYASQVAAPVFARIQQYGLRLFRIPPPTKGLGVSVPKAKTDDISQKD
jgi:cell division protein FtsI (penicillin-binding protein 3)